ncbi:MAG: hypothetical protein WAL32_09890, partial [Terriglobales bacterium]
MQNRFPWGRAAMLLALLAGAQLSVAQAGAGNGRKPSAAAEGNLKDFFQSKIKAEWEALKNKDKKAYGAL